MLLIASGIELNPGPSPRTPPKFHFATFNVDSLLARDGCKLATLEALDSIYKFDLLGICESYLHDSIPTSDIELSCFSPDPFRSDFKHFDGRPRGGVLLYYKHHLPIKRRSDLELFIDECIVVEFKIKQKKFFYVLIYRSPSQTPQEFESFMGNLQTVIDKIVIETPFSIILTGDFNARSPAFWSEELLETSEGKVLNNFSLQNGFEQVINLPTHFPRPGIETCIDHIFTNQRQIIIDSGTIPSPDPHCKHAIIYEK